MTAGLTVCEGEFHPSQFNWMVYKSSSSGGGLSCPDANARIAYYGITGFPTAKFDGTQTVVGAPADAIDGRYYRPLINSGNAQMVPLAVAISDYSFQTGSAFVEVKLRLFGDLTNITNSFIRVAVVENNLVHSGTTYHNVLRDMLPDQPLTISQNGQEQTVNVAIPMNAAWNIDNLWLIAFVQRDGDRYIFNSTSSKVGEFAVMAGVDGPRQVIADGESVTFGEVTLLNVGFGADVFDVSLDTSALPAGWSAYMTYGGQDLTEFQVSLEPFDATQLTVTMLTGESGSGRVAVNVFSQGAGSVVESIDFVALAGGTDLLVIADDAGAGHAYTSYAPALDTTGKTYAIWDRSLAPVTAAALSGYQAVVWTCGSNDAALPLADRQAIDSYLFAGGRLILAGEDIMQSLFTQGGTARIWYELRLRFMYANGNSNNLLINGVAGSPVGDGLSFTLNGGDPDTPALLAGEPVEVAMRYGNNQPAVLLTTFGAYKVAYFPYGFERVPTQPLRDTLMNQTLQWLGVLGSSNVGDLPGAPLALGQNMPNPFNPSTEIAFRTSQSGSVRLEVFNARGQLVRVLMDGVVPAGDHAVSWDGRNTVGEQAASGTYFYRLSKDGEQLTRKMSLVK